MKQQENVYFRCRKEAAKHNEKLSSREGAAEMLGVSVSTLADYELGITKVVPVDKVMLMADLYHSPELKAGYCKYECPIGKGMPIATEISGIEGIALRLIKELDPDRLKAIQSDFVEVAHDGHISDAEKPIVADIARRLDQLALVIAEIRLVAEKTLSGKGGRNERR